MHAAIQCCASQLQLFCGELEYFLEYFITQIKHRSFRLNHNLQHARKQSLHSVRNDLAMLLLGIEATATSDLVTSCGRVKVLHVSLYHKMSCNVLLPFLMLWTEIAAGSNLLIMIFPSIV